MTGQLCSSWLLFPCNSGTNVITVRTLPSNRKRAPTNGIVKGGRWREKIIVIMKLKKSMWNVLPIVLKSAVLFISVSPYHLSLVALDNDQMASSSHVANVPISVFPLGTESHYLPYLIHLTLFTGNNRCCTCVDLRVKYMHINCSIYFILHNLHFNLKQFTCWHITQNALKLPQNWLSTFIPPREYIISQTLHGISFYCHPQDTLDIFTPGQQEGPKNS